jgi:hypothetical protein
MEDKFEQKRREQAQGLRLFLDMLMQLRLLIGLPFLNNRILDGTGLRPWASRILSLGRKKDGLTCSGYGFFVAFSTLQLKVNIKGTVDVH